MQHRSSCGAQASTEAANRQAQALTPTQLAATPRLRCRVEAPCCYEGHLVKVLCSVHDVRACLRTDAGAGSGEAAGAPAGGQDHDRTPEAGGDEEALCTGAREAEVLCGAARVFVFLHKDLAEAVKVGTPQDGWREGEGFVLLRPWDVLVLPDARFPVVLAYVGRPAG